MLLLYSMHILITGANGYIGLRLLTELSNSEHRVTAVVRNAARIPHSLRALYEDGNGSRLSIIEADLLDESTARPALPDSIDAAYYLIHSMGAGEGFKQKESSCAHHFIQWISHSKIRQIIYLSGLLPSGQELSQHLASRQAVHEILSASPIPVTTLRASIVVGSGSSSFEIIRDLVEKLPVMVTPRWAHTLCQPIAVRNVIDYLLGILCREEAFGRSYDIGGPQQMTYLDMLHGYARARNLKRFAISVPVFTPRLSSYWLQLVTATNYHLAKALVSSLHMETICKEDSIKELIKLDLLTYDEAIQRAFSKIAQNRVPSTWYGALSSGKLSHRQLQSIQVPEFGVLLDQQRARITAAREDVIDAVWSIGGKRGWPNMLWAWKLRGFLDQLVGGIGMRRGRRCNNQLRAGDALDFWRVIMADKATGRLILFAEMKIPGEAWLSFEVVNDQLIQTATFRPRGIWGRIYWYSTLPFHLILFPSMARILASGWPNKDT